MNFFFQLTCLHYFLGCWLLFSFSHTLKAGVNHSTLTGIWVSRNKQWWQRKLYFFHIKQGSSKRILIQGIPLHSWHSFQVCALEIKSSSEPVVMSGSFILLIVSSHEFIFSVRNVPIAALLQKSECPLAFLSIQTARISSLERVVTSDIYRNSQFIWLVEYFFAICWSFSKSWRKLECSLRRQEVLEWMPSEWWLSSALVVDQFLK